ncbi:unnamed protein product [Closterium sp. NIES-53]
MDAEMASCKSTGTYIDEVPPLGANIVSGMWIFRVKRPPGSPPALKSRYVARVFSQRQGVGFFQTFSPTPKMTTLRVLLHVAAQRDSELHSLDFSTAFLQGSLHEGIWLCRPPGFTGTTLLATLGFAPSTADPSLFLRTNATLPPFYVRVYVDDLVFATADTEALAHVKSELQKRHTCTDLGELTSYLGLRNLTAVSSQPSIFVSSQSSPSSFWFSSFFSAGLAQHGVCPADRLWHLTDGLRGNPWSSFAGSLRCEAEIYAGAMAAQELRWLTYLLTDLGEAPRSPLVLYVDNKAMLALCQEHRLEHRTKHIALRYFLARELQQRGQLRLAYVASQANTADVFTKALQPCDHHLCFVFLDWSCDPFFSPTLPMGLLTFTVISRCCSPGVQIALKSWREYLDAGHRAWHFIESTYQVIDALYIGQLEEQLSHIRMGEEETATDYCNRARQILATMRMAGVHYSTASYLTHDIKGLTSSYNMLK